MFKRFLIVFTLAACLFAVSAAADHKLEKGVAAPDGIPAALKGVVQPQGVRLLDDAGAPYAEIWLHKQLAGESKEASGEILYPGIPEGSFVGVWRFVAPGADCRSQAIKPGFFSMRYALMPMDGNHLGAAQYRDFILLVPAAADSDPATNLKFDEVIALSRKASGTGHPASFPMSSPENVSDAALAKNDQGNWILKARIPAKSGGVPVAITVVGRAEQ